MAHVTRSDLIGTYIGQTRGKTWRLLEKHSGNVVIDESHMLVTNDYDLFGKEALATIKEYKSKRPSNIIFR